MRRVMPDEELTIFYGHKLWFDPVDAVDCARADLDEEREDGWGGLASLDAEDDSPAQDDALFGGYADGDSEELVPEEALPFTRLKLTPEDEEEEDMDAVRKGMATYSSDHRFLISAFRGRMGRRLA